MLNKFLKKHNAGIGDFFSYRKKGEAYWRVSPVLKQHTTNNVAHYNSYELGKVFEVDNRGNLKEKMVLNSIEHEQRQ